MDKLKIFIRDYIKRGGIVVFLSTFLGKFSAAFLSIIIVRMVSKTEYADIAYVLSIYAMMLVFSGLGGSYALLRFGALARISKRKLIYKMALIKGAKYTIFIIFVISVIILFLDYFQLRMKILLFIMLVGILTYYMFDVLRNYFRIIDINKFFAKLNVFYSVSSLIIIVGLTYFFKAKGYIIGLVITPLIIFLAFNKKAYVKKTIKDVKIKGFWSYGLHTSFGSLANQIIFSIAPILIEIVSNDKQEIAVFKVATLIPFNVLVLPGILMQSDFTVLARNYNSKKYLYDYYKNYLKLIVPFSILFFGITIFFAEQIIIFLFGNEYLDAVLMYQIFMAATFFTFLFRNPTGNILLAIGKAKWNGYNSYVFSVLYIVFSLVLFPYFKVYSFVYSLAFVFIMSGFVSFAMFLFYIKQLKE